MTHKLRQILVRVDLSAPSAHALRWAEQVARSCNAELHVYALEPRWCWTWKSGVLVLSLSIWDR